MCVTCGCSNDPLCSASSACCLCWILCVHHLHAPSCRWSHPLIAHSPPRDLRRFLTGRPVVQLAASQPCVTNNKSLRATSFAAARLAAVLDRPTARRRWTSSSFRFRPAALRAALRCRSAATASGSSIVCIYTKNIVHIANRSMCLNSVLFVELLCRAGCRGVKLLRVHAEHLLWLASSGVRSGKLEAQARSIPLGKGPHPRHSALATDAALRTSFQTTSPVW